MQSRTLKHCEPWSNCSLVQCLYCLQFWLSGDNNEVTDYERAGKLFLVTLSANGLWFMKLSMRKEFRTHALDKKFYEWDFLVQYVWFQPHCVLFSSPGTKWQGELLWSVFVRCLLTFDLLNPWPNFEIISHKWSLGGPLQKIFKWFWSIAYLGQRG